MTHPTPTTRTLACRMPLPLNDEMVKVIKTTGSNVNAFIIDAVDSYIRQIKGAEETRQLKIARFAYNIDNPNDKNK